jgi:hypothetical protein
MTAGRSGIQRPSTVPGGMLRGTRGSELRSWRRRACSRRGRRICPFRSELRQRGPVTCVPQMGGIVVDALRLVDHEASSGSPCDGGAAASRRPQVAEGPVEGYASGQAGYGTASLRSDGTTRPGRERTAFRQARRPESAVCGVAEFVHAPERAEPGHHLRLRGQGRRAIVGANPLLVLRVGYVEAFAADGDDQSFVAEGL